MKSFICHVTGYEALDGYIFIPEKSEKFGPKDSTIQKKKYRCTKWGECTLCASKNKQESAVSKDILE